MIAMERLAEPNLLRGLEARAVQKSAGGTQGEDASKRRAMRYWSAMDGLIHRYCNELQEALTTAEGVVPRLIARVAAAYRNDPWDAIRDSRPGGLEDDLVVLAEAARRAGVAPRDDLRDALDVAHLLSVRPWISAALRIAFAPPEGALDAHRRERVTELSSALAICLDQLGFDGQRSAEWLAVAPATAEPAPGPTVGLYGRTSSGKTTLMRRVLERLAPRYANLLEHLRSDSRAHTTRIPFVFDFRPELAGYYWSGSAPGLDLRGALRPGEVENEADLVEHFVADGGPVAGWVVLTLPSDGGRPLRLVDMPGTHGFLSGPWGRISESLGEGFDALVLPMDRRFFRSEERANLESALSLDPPRGVAVTLRWVDPTAGAMSPERFLSERIAQGMEGSPVAERAGRIVVFEIARTADSEDQIGDLVEWVLARPRVARRSATYDEIEERALDGEPAALEALAYLGLLRAWTSINAADETG